MINNKIDRIKQLRDEEGIDFVSRFACLMEAVNITCDKAEELGMDTEVSSLWIKPIAFQKYVDERHKDMKSKVVDYFKALPE
jgi:hypothetical protein